MSPGRHTLRKLRTRYQTTWSRDWPYPDSYLTELWLESRANITARVPPEHVWEDCLIAMRETHEWEPTPCH